MPDYTSDALAAGLPPGLARYLPRIIQIESGGNPNARTGSYTGLLQMGPDERAQYGGDSAGAGMALIKDRADQFQKQFGRAPTPTELYLTHQQGPGGIAAHMGNPDAPAWQNMASTAEGRSKGDAWAKRAIWGNVPDDLKAQYPGGVDSLTSGQFMDLWRHKVEGTPPGGAPGGTAVAAAQPTGMLSGDLTAPAAPAMAAPVNVGTTAPAATGGPDYNSLAQQIPKVLAAMQGNGGQQSNQLPALQPMSFPVPPGVARQRMIAALGMAGQQGNLPLT